ncbi:uncharacterized protein LOC124490275 [Dermatophagoides farinae]|uniref:uncharacterized protein LOC124490275 n=1 Tax=Dermatophagoides farinae TaxID=6954 RepID=UPI003F5EBB60
MSNDNQPSSNDADMIENIIKTSMNIDERSTIDESNGQQCYEYLDISHSTPSQSSFSSSNKSHSKRKNKSNSVHNEDDDDDQSNSSNQWNDDDGDNINEKMWCISHMGKHLINRKDSLLRLQCDLYAGHKWNSFTQLTDALIIDRRLPCYILMRNFIFTLYRSEPSHLSNGDRMQQTCKFIWKLLFVLDERYETMIELINYFIHVGDHHQQPSLLTQGKSFMNDLNKELERRFKVGGKKRQILKSYRMLIIIFRIYMEYLDLIEWKRNRQIYASVSDIRVEKLKTNFTDIIDHLENEPLPELNLDIVPMIMLELLLGYQNNNTQEAFEMLLKYSKIFPDNLNGYVFLYEFTKKFNHLNIDHHIQIDCLRNIVRLCPDSKYVLRLIRQIVDDEPVECLEMICDFLDYKSNYDSLKAWKLLHQTLIRLFNTTTTTNDNLLQIRKYLHRKLNHWQHIHFRLDQLNNYINRLRRNDCLDDLSDSNYDNSDDEILSIDTSSTRSLSSNIQNLYRFKGKIIEEIHRQFPDLINCDFTHLIIFFKIHTKNL